VARSFPAGPDQKLQENIAAMHASIAADKKPDSNSVFLPAVSNGWEHLTQAVIDVLESPMDHRLKHIAGFGNNSTAQSRLIKKFIIDVKTKPVLIQII
jgi:hypothetical protein